MKVKFLGALLLTATLTFFGCDDNTGTLGIGMLPGSDGISALTTKYPVTTVPSLLTLYLPRRVQVMWDVLLILILDITKPAF